MRSEGAGGEAWLQLCRSPVVVGSVVDPEERPTQNLKMWPCLERGSLQMQSSSGHHKEVILDLEVVLNPMTYILPGDRGREAR